MAMRRFKDRTMRAVYETLRNKPPADPDRDKGRGACGNAYWVGWTQPDEPPRMWTRGSAAYAAWAAGVDNRRAADKLAAKAA